MKVPSGSPEIMKNSRLFEEGMSLSFMMTVMTGVLDRVPCCNEKIQIKGYLQTIFMHNYKYILHHVIRCA